jgi:hypothetical protein
MSFRQVLIGNLIVVDPQRVNVMGLFMVINSTAFGESKAQQEGAIVSGRIRYEFLYGLVFFKSNYGSTI